MYSEKLQYLRYYLVQHNKLGLEMVTITSGMFCYTYVRTTNLKSFELLSLEFRSAVILKPEVISTETFFKYWCLLY